MPAEQALLLSFSKWKDSSVKGRCRKKEHHNTQGNTAQEDWSPGSRVTSPGPFSRSYPLLRGAPGVSPTMVLARRNHGNRRHQRGGKVHIRVPDTTGTSKWSRSFHNLRAHHHETVSKKVGDWQLGLGDPSFLPTHMRKSPSRALRLASRLQRRSGRETRRRKH